MQEEFKLIFGTLFLILAYPLGNILRKYTGDEQKIGKPWFILLTLFGLIGGLLGLILRKDWLMFTCFFIAIISSRSLKKLR